MVSEFYLKQLRSFHSRVARYITGRHIRQNEDGTWHYPSTSDVLEAAGFETVDEYIKRRRDTVREHMRRRPIYDLCQQSTAVNHKAVWWNIS